MQGPADTETGPQAAYGGHGFQDKNLAFCTLRYASLRTTENAVTHSDAVYGFGK